MLVTLGLFYQVSRELSQKPLCPADFGFAAGAGEERGGWERLGQAPSLSWGGLCPVATEQARNSVCIPPLTLHHIWNIWEEGFAWSDLGYLLSPWESCSSRKEQFSKNESSLSRAYLCLLSLFLSWMAAFLKPFSEPGGPFG